LVVEGGADAFLAPIGSIVNFADDFGTGGRRGQRPMTGDQFLIGAVEHALAIGADAIKCMTYPFTGDDSRSISAQRWQQTPPESACRSSPSRSRAASPHRQAHSRHDRGRSAPCGRGRRRHRQDLLHGQPRPP
jgi:hypothetical protein